MARPAIDIIQDAKRKIEKRRINFRPAPFYDASQAADLCDPSNYVGNNKSEYIRKLATAAAYLICEIETIQAIKGDGIIQNDIVKKYRHCVEGYNLEDRAEELDLDK